MTAQSAAWPATSPAATRTVRRADARATGTVTTANFMATRRSPRGLPPSELGSALLHERRRALDPVVRREQSGEELALPCQAGRQVHAQAAVDGELRGTQGESRSAHVRADQV